MVCQRVVASGGSQCGEAWQGRLGMVRMVRVMQGVAGEVGQVGAWYGPMWSGSAGEVRLGGVT